MLHFALTAALALTLSCHGGVRPGMRAGVIGMEQTDRAPPPLRVRRHGRAFLLVPREYDGAGAVGRIQRGSHMFYVDLAWPAGLLQLVTGIKKAGIVRACTVS